MRWPMPGSSWSRANGLFCTTRACVSRSRTDVHVVCGSIVDAPTRRVRLFVSLYRGFYPDLCLNPAVPRLLKAFGRSPKARPITQSAYQARNSRTCTAASDSVVSGWRKRRSCPKHEGRCERSEDHGSDLEISISCGEFGRVVILAALEQDNATQDGERCREHGEPK